MKKNQHKKETKEGHIFISYSRKDRKIADWISRQLTAGGFKIWIDRRDIPGGIDWAATIATAIAESEAIIVILSPHSVESNEVLHEIEIATQNNIRIIPLLIRDFEWPVQITKSLEGLQQIIYWRRKQASVVELINSLGGLRGVAAVLPNDSTVVIRENARLIAELLRISQEVSFSSARLIFSGGEEWPYYIQFLTVRDSPEIYAEAVGNANLPDEHQVSVEHAAKLKELGWQDPGGKSAGNYWRKWQAYTDRDRATVAAVVVNTFMEVYGHLWGEHIDISEIDLG